MLTKDLKELKELRAEYCYMVDTITELNKNAYDELIKTAGFDFIKKDLANFDQLIDGLVDALEILDHKIEQARIKEEVKNEIFGN